jgi:DNA-binding transcriptional LysR family regulator
MDIKQLQYFLQVSKDGNVTKAASSLYLSQQALSSSLVRLEKELGCILMKRNSRGIILTNAGEYFKIQAQKIIDIANETQV